MAQPAVISREEAAKQQSAIQPAAPEVPEAPKRAAPGSHPGAPVESDPEALAAYQGRDLVEARTPTHGSWHLNAFNQPVFVAEVASPGSARRSTTEPNEEPMEPPSKRAEPQGPPKREK